MAAYLHNFWQEEDGQDLTEYSLVITFVALVCVAFLGIFKSSVNGMWLNSNSHLSTANTTAS